jgi:hypothetical protein
MIVSTPAVTALMTVNATAAGIVTVADSAPFYCGAKVSLSGDAPLESVSGTITDIPDTTHIGVRLDHAKDGAVSYGRSDLSAYTVAKTSKITMPAQTLSGKDELSLKSLGEWNGLA